MNDYRPDMPIAELFQDWHESNPRLKSKETVRLMRSSVRRFVEYIGRPVVLSDLTEKTLNGFIHHRQQLGMAASTIEREAAKVVTLWRWAALRGWCKSPMVSFGKAQPPTPTAWSRQELRRLFRAAEEYATPIRIDGRNGRSAKSESMLYTTQNARGSVIMVPLLRLLFETGERVAATLALTWADVDLDGRWVTFRAVTRKGRGKAADNVQKISRRTAAVLRELQKARALAGYGEPSSTVFPQKNRASWYGNLKTILRAAGLPQDRRSCFHRLRRTHATHLYVVGGDPTASLGHGSDAMTRSYYLDPRFTRTGYAADLLNGGVLQPLRRLVRRVKIAIGLW